MRRSAVGLALVLATGEAHGYCRQTTVSEDTCQSPVGTPIAWPSPCMTYSLHVDGTPDVAFASLEDAIRRSMNVWNDATIEGESAPCTAFRFHETDDATCTKVEYSQDCGNVNVVLWRESGWVTERGHDQGAIGLSTIFFKASTAEIVSADMELNGEFYEWDVRDDYTACQKTEEGCPADVQNTVTHEAGHLLGLSHVANPEATMDFAEVPGDTNKRTLDPDDVDAVCDIYPASAGRDCDPTPPGGLDLACEECGGCCHTAPGTPLPDVTVVLGVVLAGLWVALRRGRRS